MSEEETVWSVELADKLKNRYLSELSLPANLTAQAFLITHLPPERLRGILWCLPSHRELAAAADLLRFWLKLTNRRLSDTSFKILIFPDDFIVWLNAQHAGQMSILLVAREHLELALPAAKELTDKSLKLKVGEFIKLTDVINKLIAAGYEPGPLPDNTGWFQKIGGSLIISTVLGHWRLTWQNNELDSIDQFSLASGLTQSKTQTLTIFPHRLAPDKDESLARYLDQDNLLLGFPTAYLPKHKLRLPVSTGARSALFAAVPLFVKQWPEFLTWLQKKNENREKVIILTTTPHRLPPLPASVRMVDIDEDINSILSGFADQTSQTHYITDRELFGAPKVIRRRSLAAYEKLKPGDYLVHIDHGIGRFGGLVQKISGEQTREYFMIEYAQGDKLYVPIEHTDRLSRYLGSPHPALERLSSAHWFQVRKKIKKETAALANELLTLYAKRQISQVKPWPAAPEEEVLAAAFPYPLTSDQLKAWAEIDADLTSRQPMDRLICGDVGFGKTELAVRAAARAAFNGYQTAILAPTTILAQQHFDTFSERLKNFGIKIGLVSRSQTTAEIKLTLKALAQGQLDIIIGTHRLLGADVTFAKLGLLIIDEEQRFGVKQKEKLRALKPSLHVLALSATPIPRTLNLAVASLRDLSIMLSPPVGRQAIKIHFANLTDSLIKKAINLELKRNGQIFYLVQHVKDLPAAETRLKQLLPKLKLGVVHGRKPPREVAKIMHQFDTRALDLLLATSIIENGLDLPNVNTLIVENAQNFGLADLYQLKGRIGRGQVQAQAYFLIPKKITPAADKRLDALAQTEELGSGLSLALKDLELRGAGAILGREQHGHVSAVGLHLYGQMLADAIEEQRSGQPLPAIPEVRLNLPLEGRISSDLIPDEEKRIYLYQRLASLREPNELFRQAAELIGRPLNDSKADRLLKNLLTLLEIKLLAEKARLQEISCHAVNNRGQFSLKFLDTPSEETITRLTKFDKSWHKVESSWQASYPLAAGAWIPWLKQSLKLITN
jgi:transcription-repair coupling factor